MRFSAIPSAVKGFNPGVVSYKQVEHDRLGECSPE